MKRVDAIWTAIRDYDPKFSTAQAYFFLAWCLMGMAAICVQPVMEYHAQTFTRNAPVTYGATKDQMMKITADDRAKLERGIPVSLQDQMKHALAEKANGSADGGDL